MHSPEGLVSRSEMVVLLMRPPRLKPTWHRSRLTVPSPTSSSHAGAGSIVRWTRRSRPGTPVGPINRTARSTGLDGAFPACAFLTGRSAR